MNTMKAVVFHGVNDIRVEEVARPRPKPGEAVIRITVTTICGTDVAFNQLLAVETLKRHADNST